MLRVLLPIILAVFSVAGSGEVIQACVDKDDGSVRIVSTSAACHENEYELRWGILGPQGPQGPQGPRGPQGPAGVIDLNCEKDQTIVWNEAAVEWACSDELQRLRAESADLARQLALHNRNSAAVVPFDRGGSSTRPYDSLIMKFGVCSHKMFYENGESCPKHLEWTLTTADKGKNFVYGGANPHPDLQEMLDLLTDGEDGFVEVITLHGPGGGGGITHTPESSFFRETGAPRAVDLRGFDIDRISMTVDLISIFPGATTRYNLDGKFFFELTGTEAP